MPHQRATTIEPALVQHLGEMDGALVLFENTPHRDMDADPARDIYPAPLPAFARRWASGPWSHYEFLKADPRDVVVSPGTRQLIARTPLGACVSLDGVRSGARVVVRTNFYPVWTAWDESSPVPMIGDEGMLAFDAPRDGTYEIELQYPARTSLLALAFGVLIVSAAFATRLGA